MNFKKLTALLMTGAVSASLLAGCGSTGTTEKTASKGDKVVESNVKALRLGAESAKTGCGR